MADTGAIINLLVLVINLVFGSWLAEFPLYARVALTVVGQGLLMTYLVIPRVTRLLQSWVFAN